jgi:hypothetical protein
VQRVQGAQINALIVPKEKFKRLVTAMETFAMQMRLSAQMKIHRQDALQGTTSTAIPVPSARLV